MKKSILKRVLVTLVLFLSLLLVACTKTDFTNLESVIASSSEKVEAEYTSASWDAFETALQGARDVLENTKSKQEEVDAAITALQTALEALVKRGDKTQLNALITSTKALNSEAYTSNTYSAIADKLASAEAVANNVDAIQSEIDAAKTALQAVVDALVLRGDNADLSTLITSASALNINAYTAETWAELAAKLAAAQEVAKNADATQTEIDAAKTALQAAIDGLLISKNELIKLVDVTKELHKELYVESTWKALETAQDAAQKVIDNASATYDDVLTAIANLNTAKEALEKHTFVYEGTHSGLWRGGKIEAGEDGKYVITLPFVAWSRVQFTYNGEVVSFDNTTISGLCLNQESAPWDRNLYTEDGSTFLFSMGNVTYEYIFTYDPEAKTLDVTLPTEENQLIANTINKDAGADAIAVMGEGTKIFDATTKTWVNNAWKYYFVFDAEGRICHAVASPGAGYGGPTGNDFYRNYYYVDKSTNPAFVTVSDGIIDIVVPKGGFAISAYGAGATKMLDLLTNGQVVYSGNDIAKYNAYSAAFSQGLRVKCDLNSGIVTISEKFDTEIPVVKVDADCGAEAVSVYGEGTKIHTASGWLNEWRSWIVVDKDGKITYAVFAPDNGYGGPTETTYYTHPSYTDYTKNPSIVLLEGFGPWVQGGTAHNQFEIVVPEGGFAISTHGSMINDLLARNLSNNTLGYAADKLPDVNNRNAFDENVRLSFNSETKTISVSSAKEYVLTVPEKGTKWTEYTALDTDGIYFATNELKTEEAKITSYEAENLTFTTQFSLTKGKIQIKDAQIVNGFRLVLDKEAKITVYAALKSGKSGTLQVIDTNGEIVTASNLLINGVSATEFDELSVSTIVKYEFTLSAGEYGLGGSSGGAYVYGMKVTK